LASEQPLILHRPDGRAFRLDPTDVVYVDEAGKRSSSDYNAVVVLAELDSNGDNKSVYVREPADVVAQKLAAAGSDNWAAA
jgi:hypothetical protein